MTSDAKEGLAEPTAVPKGRYRIVSDLGAGGFGNVSLAEDEATGQEVAIRFLPRGLAAVPRAAQTRQRMGGSIVAASTAHPALVRVLEFGDAENGHAFVAMELVQGRRLSEILSEGPLDVSAALRLAIDLGGAVETLHNLGFVHGALRPRNVMVREDGSVKLMDVELIGLREAWTMKGIIAEESPPEYLAPEQISGLPATEATDVYALAAILYEMLCGKPPFQAETREAVLAKHLTETPAPMRRRRRTVPGSVESVVALALSKPPQLRPPIHDVLNLLWEEADGPATWWKRKAAIAGGGVLVASIAVAVGWGLFTSVPPAPSALTRPAPPTAVKLVPVSAPAPSSAPTTQARTAPTLVTATPAVVPAAAAARAQPAPPSGVERREQPRAPQVPAGPSPAVVPPPAAARATPQSAPPSGVERREQPRAPQVPEGPPRARSAVSSDAGDSDFDAAIDWMLERSAGRRQ